MIKKIGLIVCFQLLYASLLNGEIAQSQANIPTSKIQAAFWGINSVEQGEEQLRLLKTYGFNTALVNDSGYQVKENLWLGWGEIADKYAISLFPIHSFAGTDEIKVLRGKFRPYVNRQGTVFPSTPCPLDEDYWNVSIGQRFAQLAQISKSTHLAGILFDTEMYGSDVSVYPDFCFCDACWRKFIQAKQQGISTTIAKENRFDELIEYNLFQQYANFQQEQLQTILAAIEKQVHSINPNLWLGFLAYVDNWFYRGLIRGLGTTAKPVLVFSESTYIRGYTPSVTEEKMLIEGKAESRSTEAQKLRRSEEQKTEGERELNENPRPIARYIPGLWLGRFFPEDIPSQAYNLAIHTAGYWIFTAYSLWTDEQKSGHYTLHGSNQEYWLAFKQANDELQQFSQAPETYQSDLPPVYLSSFYDASQNRLITQSSLKYLLHDIGVSGIPESIRSQESYAHQNTPEIVYRGKTLFHCLKNPFLSLSKGEIEGTERSGSPTFPWNPIQIPRTISFSIIMASYFGKGF
jgi:hypothetical protein